MAFAPWVNDALSNHPAYAHSLAVLAGAGSRMVRAVGVTSDAWIDETASRRGCDGANAERATAGWLSSTVQIDSQLFTSAFDPPPRSSA